MKKIVLLRHGESVWNRENRFTGWTDVDLSEKGVAEAVKAGETLRKEGFHFGRAYTSYLKRAVKTLDVVLDRMDRDWIPVTKTWRLNEKHYGMLQGLNKRDTAEKYGDRAGVRLAPQLRRGPRAASGGLIPAIRASIPVTPGFPTPRCPAPSR